MTNAATHSDRVLSVSVVSANGSWMRPAAAILAHALLMSVGCAGDDNSDDAASASASESGTDDTTDAGSSTGGAQATGTLDDTAGADASSGSTAADDTSDESSGDTAADSTGDTTGAEVCSVVLAEIVFNPTGDDNEQQWIKLKNLCSYDIDLAAWTIGYAGEHYGDNRQKRLDGDGDPNINTVIPAFGCYLVGGPTTDVANGMPVYDWPDDFAPGLSYDPEIGSGVALFDLPPERVDETTVPLDAVIYGPNNDAGLIDHTGEPADGPHVGLPPEGGSITRTGAGPQWDLNVAPQAGNCPTF